MDRLQKGHQDRTWLTISRAALLHNLRTCQRQIGSGVTIAPVIKANAYGHGKQEVAATLQNEPIWGFGVAYGAEALALRTAGIRNRILTMSFWEAEELTNIVRHKIEVAIWDRESMRAAIYVGQKMGRPVDVHMKLDIGTTRIGFQPDAAEKNLLEIRRQKHIRLRGIFSHFANSEARTTTSTRKQLRLFGSMVAPFEHDRTLIRHVACTAAALRYPASRYDMIRLGIGLYGIWPSENARQAATSRQITLEPALSWFTRIHQLKKVPAGTAVGYGSTYRVKRRSTIAIVPVGYADGYPRAASNRADVAVSGRRAPVAGRVCMNLMMIDVSSLRSVHRGQTVELIGPTITADEVATTTATIPYEILSRLPAELPRYYQ